MAKHGRAVYWKGVANKHLHYPSIGKAHEKVIEAVKTGKFQAAILYEYFSLNKVNDVPQSATAFRREAMGQQHLDQCELGWKGPGSHPGSPQNYS